MKNSFKNKDNKFLHYNKFFTLSLKVSLELE